MAVEDDIKRKQDRIAFLQKSRPGDPEIAKRKAEIKALQAQPATPVSTGLTAGPGVKDGAFVGPQQPGSPDINNPAAPTAPSGGTTPVAPPSGFQPTPTPNPASVDLTTPNGAAGGQQGANDSSTDKTFAGSNPNVTGPFGSHTVTRDPVTGQPIVNDQLTGANKDIYDAESGADATAAKIAQGMLAGYPTAAFDPNAVNGQYGIPTANSADRTRVEGELYNKYTQDLDQNFAKSMEAKKQELANRGIPLGSEQYKDQIDQLQKGYDRSKLEARSQATIGGGQELSTQFGLGLQGHQQAFSDYTAGYTLPASLAGSLVGIGQGYQNPQYQGVQGANYSPVDYTSLYGQASAAALQAQQMGIDVSQFDKQFAEDKRQFGVTIAEQRRQANLAAAVARAKSGGGSASTDESFPAVGGVAGLPG